METRCWKVRRSFEDSFAEAEGNQWGKERGSTENEGRRSAPDKEEGGKRQEP